MESREILGMWIGLVATGGGLMVGALILYMAIRTESKAKIAAIEARNKERLALIEKGMDPGLLDKPAKKRNPDVALLWGCLLGGIGLGALLGYLIAYATGLNTVLFVNASAILLGGLALIIYNKKRATLPQRSKNDV